MTVAPPVRLVSDKLVLMSRVALAAFLCACALAVHAAADPAPAPPRRSENKESRVMQEKTIAVRRMPIAYFYPFSLWPMPRFIPKDRGDTPPIHKRSIEEYEINYDKR